MALRICASECLLFTISLFLFGLQSAAIWAPLSSIVSSKSLAFIFLVSLAMHVREREFMVRAGHFRVSARARERERKMERGEGGRDRKRKRRGVRVVGNFGSM